MRYRLLGSSLICLLTIVTTIAAQDGSRPLYELPDARTPVYRSGSMALTQDGRALVVANMLANTVSIVNLAQWTILAEIPVGHDPRTVAVTPDNTCALVVNRTDGTLSVIDLTNHSVGATYVVGGLPYAVVTPNNQTAYVSLQGADMVIQIEIATGQVVARIPVPDSPAGLTVWGDLLYVTHLWSGGVSLVYLPQRAVARTVSLGSDTSLSQSLSINPNNGRAYLPQSRSNAQNQTPTFDTWIFPIVNVLDLNTMTVQRDARIALDIVDRPVNMPFAAAVGTYRNWLYLVNAGSDDLSVIDLNTGTVTAHLSVGANPRDVRLNRDGSLLYVHNVIDASITIIETRTMTVRDTAFISDVIVPVDRLIGAQLFNTARDPRIGRDNRISCANCHFDGQSDGRIWPGFTDGPRNTPALFGLAETAPYTWAGEWDELTDMETHIRELQAGRGFTGLPLTSTAGSVHAGLSIDLDLLAAYLLTLDAPTSPTGANAANLERGAAVFAEQGCASCHNGTMHTDGRQHDVGTGGAFDTPVLTRLELSAPYLHDGRAATLRDVFILPGIHQLVADVPLEDIDALVEYLTGLPQ